MLSIKLRIDNQYKTFSTDFISGRMFRKALELDEKRNQYVKNVVSEVPATWHDMELLLNKLYQFIADLFGNQFTSQEYEDGTDARKIVDQSWMIVHGVIGQTMEPLSEIGTDDSKKKTMLSLPNL